MYSSLLYIYIFCLLVTNFNFFQLELQRIFYPMPICQHHESQQEAKVSKHYICTQIHLYHTLLKCRNKPNTTWKNECKTGPRYQRQSKSELLRTHFKQEDLIRFTTHTLRPTPSINHYSLVANLWRLRPSWGTLRPLGPLSFRQNNSLSS